MHQPRLILALMGSLSVVVPFILAWSEDAPTPSPQATVQVLQRPCALAWDPVTSCQTTGTDAVPCTPQTYRLYLRRAPASAYPSSPAAEVTHPTTRVTCDALHLSDAVVYAASVTAVGVREDLALTAPESPRSPDVLFQLASQDPEVQVLQRPCALTWNPVLRCQTSGQAFVACTPQTYRLYLRQSSASAYPSSPSAEVTHPTTHITCDALDLADEVVYGAVVTAVGVRQGLTLTTPESARSPDVRFRVSPEATLP